MTHCPQIGWEVFTKRFAMAVKSSETAAVKICWGDIFLHAGLYRKGVFAMALYYSFKNTNSDGIIFNQHKM
jgi:hypothetical protein